jgi:hypothetical protein
MIGRLALTGATLLAVSACRPVDRVGQYAVARTAVFETAGRRTEQTVHLRCHVVRLAHREEYVARPEGEPNFLPRPDGAILVLRRGNPCSWTFPLPAEGARSDQLDQGRFGVLFDDVREPTSAVNVPLQGELAPPGGPRLISLSATVVPDRPPSEDLRSAFPGAVRDSGGGGADAVPYLERGGWVTARALSRQLPPDACPGVATPTMAESEDGLPACAREAPCYAGTSANPCGWTVVPTIVSPDFKRVTVESAPREGWMRPHFPARRVRAAGAPARRTQDGPAWSPEVCVTGACAPAGRSAGEVLFHDPAGSRIVNVHFDHDPLAIEDLPDSSE